MSDLTFGPFVRRQYHAGDDTTRMEGAEITSATGVRSTSGSYFISLSSRWFVVIVLALLTRIRASYRFTGREKRRRELGLLQREMAAGHHAEAGR
jgi:hypothetical protein